MIGVAARDAVRLSPDTKIVQFSIVCDEIEVVAGVATMRDAETVRLARTVDGLTSRLAALQRRPATRLRAE